MKEEKENVQNTAEQAETQAEAPNGAQTDADAAECAEETKNEKKKNKKAEAKAAELSKKLEDAEKKLAEAENKYMLLYAEYDNFRRRSQKEKDGIYSEAYGAAVNALLPVFDNLYRASTLPDEKGLADGLKMTVRGLEETLAKLGIEEIKAQGEKFNPDLHCAVFHVEDDQYGENEIIEVLAKGYVRDGKVIRYSLVKVAN